MEINPILQNVLAPPVLFFLIGAISVLFKSDLEIPAPLPKLFSLYLISNNPSKKRVAKIAKELNLKYKYNASKPRKKVTLSAIKEIGSEPKNIAIIGDRIFTDIIVGNRCNIKTILVKRLNRDGLPLKFNLTLTIEKLISHFLK